MLMRQTKGGSVVSKQQHNREIGFRHYMHEHFPQVEIIEMNLPFELPRTQYDDILKEFFQNIRNTSLHNLRFQSSYRGGFPLESWPQGCTNNGIRHGGEKRESLAPGCHFFLDSPACLHARLCLRGLSFPTYRVKNKVEPINYMPIELISKENIDFYRRTQL